MSDPTPDRTQAYSDGDQTGGTQAYSDGETNATEAYSEANPTRVYSDGGDGQGGGPATQAYTDGSDRPEATQQASPDGRTLLHGLGPGDEADLPSGTVAVEAVVAGDAGTGHRATGEAAVYRVLTEAGETRALKLYRAFDDPKHEPNPEALARIQAIQDADILRLYDFGTGERKWRGRFCYELAAFAEGGTMLAHGDGTPFETEDLRTEYTAERVETNTVPQLFLGLKRLHGLRIVHGDLKPQNVFYVDSDGEDLVIGDYGSAKTFSEADADLDIRATTVVKGTSLYVAPEQANNIISPANDYFSLGMVVFHLLYPDALTDVRTTRRSIRERMVRGEEIWPFDPAFGRLNDLIGGLTLLDPQRRWGEPEVEEWVSGGSPRVRYASQDARTEPFRLGPDVTFHTGANAAAYVEANPSEWYETLIEDADSYRMLREWLLKTEGPQRKKYFEGVVKHYQSKGRTLLREAVLRYFDPYRPIPLGPEAVPFDPAKPTEAADQVARFLVDATGDTQKDWRQRALLALEFALEEASNQGVTAATALLERARSAMGQSTNDSWTGKSDFIKAGSEYDLFRLSSALSAPVGREQVRQRAEAALAVADGESQTVLREAVSSLESSDRPLAVYADTAQRLTQLSDQASERLTSLQADHSGAVAQSQAAVSSSSGSTSGTAKTIAMGIGAVYFLIALSAVASACGARPGTGMDDFAGFGLFFLAGVIAIGSIPFLEGAVQTVLNYLSAQEGLKKAGEIRQRYSSQRPRLLPAGAAAEAFSLTPVSSAQSLPSTPGDLGSGGAASTSPARLVKPAFMVVGVLLVMGFPVSCTNGMVGGGNLPRIGPNYGGNSNSSSYLGPGYVTATRLNVRTGPSTSSGTLGELPNGTPVNIVGQNGRWLRIEIDDAVRRYTAGTSATTAWVSGRYVNRGRQSSVSATGDVEPMSGPGTYPKTEDIYYSERFGYVPNVLGPPETPGGESQLALGVQGDPLDGRYIFTSVRKFQSDDDMEGRETATISLDEGELSLASSGRAEERYPPDMATGTNVPYWVQTYSGPGGLRLEVWIRYGETGADCVDASGWITLWQDGSEFTERVTGAACSFV